MDIRYDISEANDSYELDIDYYGNDLTDLLNEFAEFNIITEKWEFDKSNLTRIESILTTFNELMNNHSSESDKLRIITDSLRDRIKIESFINENQNHLYDYQKIAVNSILSNNFFLLADDMGLGKSIISLAVVYYMIKQRKYKNILIFCQKRAIKQWIKYSSKFTPDLDITAVVGTAAKRKKLWKSNHDIYITNLEKILWDFEHICYTDWDLIIIDEASYYIRNPNSKRAKKIFRLKSKNKLALTGTPIETTIVDLFSIFKFLNPNIFQNYAMFEKEYLIYIWQKVPVKKFISGKFNFSVREVKKVVGTKNLDKLKKLIAPHYIRRTAKDVSIQLPEIVVENFVIPLLEPQQKVYDKIINEVKDSPFVNSDANIIKIQRAYDHSIFIDKSINSSNKIEALMELLEENKHRKVVVFSMWSDMIYLIHMALEDLPHSIITGPGKQERFGRKIDVENELDNFEKDNMILLATDAVSRSQDIPFANVVINVDIPWNPAVIKQRIMRCRRASSKFKHVFAFNLISENTVEEYVLNKIEERTSLAKFIVDDNEYVEMPGFNLLDVLE